MGDSFITIMNIVGSMAFALSGVSLAIRKKMDIFGVIILAVVTATGGGVMRDIIIGRFPPVAFTDPSYVIFSGIVAIVAFTIVYFIRYQNHSVPSKFLETYNKANFWFDTLGLAAFTVEGVHAGLLSDESDNLFLLIFLGVITGVGGGLLRDIFAIEMPYIFTKHIYAVAAIIGAIVMGILVLYTPFQTISMMAGFLIIVCIRVLAYHFQWNLPKIKL
ncbi:MAG: trimeric intracellular cation channel family protein [Lachnospiraceae bacterium]|nr:trimeric intracellular cation channel family protein [Lachnospiraceae bacterium]